MKEIKYQQKYVRELVDMTIDLLHREGVLPTKRLNIVTNYSSVGLLPSSLATRQSTNWFGSAAAIYDAYQKVLPKRKEKLFEQEREQAETKIPRRLVRGAGRYNGIIMLKILYYLINVFFRYILNFCPDFGDASPCSHVRQLANSGNFGYARQ